MRDDNINGMTVNERLVHFSLLAAFDAAVRSGDLDAVIGVLMQAHFSAPQARATAQAVLANPRYYGFGKGDGGS
jgi:hypothetical protein